jgi:hypothetical protein
MILRGSPFLLCPLELHLNRWKVCELVQERKIQLRKYILIFETECFLFFKGRSSITRASSFLEIPDLSEEEAMIYLTEKRSLSKETAKDLYSLFGGRIKSLQNAASKLEIGVSFASKLSLCFI